MIQLMETPNLAEPLSQHMASGVLSCNHASWLWMMQKLAGVLNSYCLCVFPVCMHVHFQLLLCSNVMKICLYFCLYAISFILLYKTYLLFIIEFLRMHALFSIHTFMLVNTYVCLGWQTVI